MTTKISMKELEGTLYNYKAVCYNVVDGDTIDLNIDKGFGDSTKRRIRFSRIDTPERGQEGFQEAKDFVIKHMLDKEVFVQSSKSGSFGRWLGDMWIEIDGMAYNIQDMLLEANLAVLYKKRR